MNKTFEIDIVTPTKTIKEENIEYFRAPSKDGLFGVKYGHADATIALDIGEIKIVKEGKEKFYSSSGGFADITDNKVEVLVETIEFSSDIDSVRAQKSLDRANDRLKDKAMDEKRASISLQKALNRLKVSKR